MSRVFNLDCDPLNGVFSYNPEETERLKEKNYAEVSIDDLRQIALWKIDRVINVEDDVLDLLRKLSKQESLTAGRQCIDALIQCEGVGYPMASTILKFIRPDVFPIIDVRAYRALTGQKMQSSQYTTDIYLDYVARLNKIAAVRKIPLSEVDEQLYCFDKTHNGKI